MTAELVTSHTRSKLEGKGSHSEGWEEVTGELVTSHTRSKLEGKGIHSEGWEEVTAELVTSLEKRPSSLGNKTIYHSINKILVTSSQDRLCCE